MNVFDNSEFETYKAEVQDRWGSTRAYKEHTEKTKTYGADQWSSSAEGMDAVFEEFAACMKNGSSPDSAQAGELVKKLQDHISEHYYTCTKEILFGLGQMYAADERFKNNIDKHAAGTADFVSEAIGAYCK